MFRPRAVLDKKIPTIAKITMTTTKQTGNTPMLAEPINVTESGKPPIGAAAVISNAKPRNTCLEPIVDTNGCGSFSLVKIKPLISPQSAPVSRQERIKNKRIGNTIFQQYAHDTG